MDSPNDGSTSVLLIEDDNDYTFLIKEILEDRKGIAYVHRLRCTDRLQEGIRSLGEITPDIILLDLFLPDSRGLETFFKIRNVMLEVPCVILTTLEDEGLGIDAVKQGAQDYLVKKQINREILVRTLHHSIERHRLKKKLEYAMQELKVANARLQQLAILDPLTEMINRRGLEQALQREIQWSSRVKSELIAVLVDLDNFKKIDDQLGYVAGDIVLKEVAARIKRSVRNTDYVSRIGGDEFVVLLPDTKRESAVPVVDRIRRSIADEPVQLPSGGTAAVTASLGVVSVLPGDTEIERLLAKAQSELRRSKDEGKNRVSYEKS